MLETRESLVVEALTEALERMAFMVASSPEEDLPQPTKGVMVTMHFYGPVSGSVELLGGNEFMQMLAANVMGEDPDSDEAHSQGTDALKELLNTTCGVLLPMLASTPEDIFDITVPASQNLINPQDWNTNLEQKEPIVLDVDGFWLAVRMTIK